MKKQLMRSIFIVIITVLITLTMVAASTNIQRVIAFVNGDLKMKFNGELFQPKEDNGTFIKPIVYNGRTYLPVRVVGELAGMQIDYDKNSNTILIVSDTSGAIPYKDSKDSGSDTGGQNEGKDNEDKGAYKVPKVEAKVDGNHIIVRWDKINDSRLQGYKVVISKDNETPEYPDDGYLYWITDKSRTTASIDNREPYKGGDFGEHLTPGESYYFSITAVYDNAKVPGNVIKLTYPNE